MEFLFIIVVVLALFVWYLLSTRHDGSVRCPKCKAVNAGTTAPCWKCQYEFQKRPEELGELKTCPKCNERYYLLPNWHHDECYKCYSIAHPDE